MNKYQQTISEIFDLQKFAIKLGLENITKLSQSLDNPHLNYPTIHIAGTNGKGSTAIILQQILQKHGLKVGLYTSPHLVEFNERIRINDELISDTYIVDFWKRIRKQVLRHKATFFDTTTCLAFDYFSKNKIDAAIFETGLGGRLDSTNIIQPEAAVITPIDFDHQKQLGNSLTSIAAEKAGIIKDGINVFLGHQKKEVLKYFVNHKFNNKKFINKAKSISELKIKSTTDKTLITFKDNLRNEKFEDIHLNLPGIHQGQNACLAYLVGRWYLEKSNTNFNPDFFSDALSHVNWPGRIQKISEAPDIYIDVSHNVDGFRKTIKYISANFEKEKIYLLLGLLEDKNVSEIINIVKDEFNNIIVTEPDNHRRLSGSIIINELKKYGINSKFIKDVPKAFEISIKNLKKKETLFIMGSHYLVGNVLRSIRK